MLSDRDKAILDFERTWFKYAGAKEAAVRERFGIGGTRYYQIRSALLDRREALEYAPQVVNRPRRRRVASQRAPGPRRLGLTS